jgi:hypothetical protein
VNVDPLIVGQLAAYALNSIDTEDGCCPNCCAPCDALATLLCNNQLDEAVAAYVAHTGEAWTWWMGGKVDRGWLAHALRRTDCHRD